MSLQNENQNYVPLKFWFNSPPKIIIPPLKITFNEIYKIDSKYEEIIDTDFLLDKNEGCGCVSDTILPYFNQWVADNCPILNNGLDDLFNLIKNKTYLSIDELDNDTRIIIIKIICALFLRNNIDFCVVSFIESYFNYNYQEAIILLWYIDNINCITHGISLRFPETNRNSVKIVHNNIAILEQINEWINKNKDKL